MLVYISSFFTLKSNLITCMREIASSKRCSVEHLADTIDASLLIKNSVAFKSLILKTSKLFSTLLKPGYFLNPFEHIKKKKKEWKKEN